MSSRQSLTSHRRTIGFTLVELLVVIAIISLLVSILLPSLGVAKELARQVVCQSNMRQIGLSFMMYLQDSGNVFPPYYIDDAWYEKINAQLESQEVFECPSDPDFAFTRDLISYGYCYKLADGGNNGAQWPVKLGWIEDPSYTILVADSNDDGFGQWLLDPTNPAYYAGFRHRDSANVLFVDGRVEWLANEEIHTEPITVPPWPRQSW